MHMALDRIRSRLKPGLCVGAGTYDLHLQLPQRVAVVSDIQIP